MTDPTPAQVSYQIEEDLCDLILEYLRKHGARYLGPGRLVDRGGDEDLDPVEQGRILSQLGRLQPGAFALAVYWEDIGTLLDDEPKDGDTQGWTATICPRRQSQLTTWAITEQSARQLG